ncbi:MAG TPA: hypothetical protein VG186_03565 [Solirubrobacteraceae bacterium]|jgi:glucose-1-phosphate thymidylyltransferase|nr:hypothetical protein [Solirubrobacteraceae bacterium]
MPLTGVIVLADIGAHPCSRSGTSISALEHVANRPIAHHVLEGLRSAGVSDALLVGHEQPLAAVRDSLAGHARALGLGLAFAPHASSGQVGDGLKATARVLGPAPCIVHLANGMLDAPVTPLPRQFRVESPDLVVFVGQGAPAGERLSDATKRLLGISELDPTNAPFGMAGVCVFGAGALLRSAEAQWRDGDAFDLTEVAECLGGAGGRVRVSVAPAWHRYHGDAGDLLELNRIALDRLGPDLHQVRNNGNRIEGRVLIDETAEITSSVLIGPSVIGPGARISEACIGPYTSIGPRVRIEGAEIERSIIAAGASVMHVGGRMAASVVGRDARVFRDFSLPRAMKLRVGDGNEVGLC